GVPDDDSLASEICRRLHDDEVRILRVPEDLALDSLASVGAIRSAIAVPVRVAAHRVCALAIAGRDPSVWDKPIVERVQLLAEILTYAVDRRRQAQTLRLREAELTRLSAQLKSETGYLREEIQSLHGFNEIIGDSPVLQESLDRVREVAGTDA